jgi:hypothetical protein
LVGPEYRTKVWMSRRARDGAERLDGSIRELLYDKLAYCAENGFREYAKAAGVVVHEGMGICRVGIRPSLFRWWGFHRGFGWEEFIILDWTLKRGQKRGREGDEMVRKLAKIRDNNDWYKVA